MTDHLSEAAIQQYALDGENCPAWMTEHVKACERCSVRVSSYRLIFKEVGQMEAPVVGADIADLVLTKLGPGKIIRTDRERAQKKDWSPVYWLVGAGFLMLPAGWMFKASILNVPGDTPALILYILVDASACIAIVRALGMVVSYQRQIKNLDLS